MPLFDTKKLGIVILRVVWKFISENILAKKLDRRHLKKSDK